MSTIPPTSPRCSFPSPKKERTPFSGLRYMSAQYRRALMYRHTLMNKGLTALSNWFTDLHLTDMETGYKAINTVLLKSIPIRSNDFRFEVEITFKLAKRGARIFEVPIRYLPRTRAEGKKIGAKDGFRALFAMFHWALIDDLFQKDDYGTRLVSELEKARRFLRRKNTIVLTSATPCWRLERALPVLRISSSPEIFTSLQNRIRTICDFSSPTRWANRMFEWPSSIPRARRAIAPWERDSIPS